MKIWKYFLLILMLYSCRNDEYPSIYFIGGNNMVDQDMILPIDDSFQIGINSFTKGDNQLYKFKLIKINNNYPVIVIDSIINGRIFNAVLTLPTNEYEDIDRWVFTIISSNGYASDISVQITARDTIINRNSNNKNYNNRYIINDSPERYNNLYYYIIISIIFIFIIFIIIFYKKIKINKNKILPILNKILIIFLIILLSSILIFMNIIF